MLEPLIEHDVGLRHDATTLSDLVHDQIVAHMIVTKALTQVVQAHGCRHGVNRSTHHLADGAGKDGRLGEIDRQRIALGPDAAYLVIFHDQD